jgi:hypothetical protein|tara:strand:+ start:967 stop:1377 length:411 start_codon:yes stop_codon:yes gene_type:complete
MTFKLAWVSIKLALKKAWAWCKKYWQLLLGIAIPLVLMLVFRKKGDISAALAKVNEDYEKEIEVIEKNHAEEIEKREAAQQLYLDTVKKIENDYKIAFDSLNSKKQKEIEKLVEEYKDDPDGLTDRISKLTGINKV